VLPETEESERHFEERQDFEITGYVYADSLVPAITGHFNTNPIFATPSTPDPKLKAHIELLLADSVAKLRIDSMR
jgi:hypothetical protein